MYSNDQPAVPVAPPPTVLCVPDDVPPMLGMTWPMLLGPVDCDRLMNGPLRLNCWSRPGMTSRPERVLSMPHAWSYESDSVQLYAYVRPDTVRGSVPAEMANLGVGMADVS